MEIAIEPIIKRANSFERKHKMMYYIWPPVCVLLAARCFYFVALGGEPLFLMSVAAVGIAVLFVGAYLLIKGKLEALPDPALDSKHYVLAYREKLLKQARFERTGIYWAALPVLVTYAAHMVYIFFNTAARGGSLLVPTGIAIGVLVFASVVCMLAIRKARKLEREAAELPTDV